jgi:formylglycine-generating enzyme required for sulfatase activity
MQVKSQAAARGASDMAEEEKKKSFWETAPGIITALAALVAALLPGIAAVVTALHGTEEVAKAKEEIKATKAELAQVKAAAAAAEARAAELERKLAEAEKEIKKAKTEADVPKKDAKPSNIISDDATSMKLVYVPGGCFNMGSPSNEEGRKEDEGPVHKVCVNGFWMGKYEVTQGQWEKVVDNNPSEFKKGGNYPVENVSWNDTQNFINKLNSKTGKDYRLPTEAEWEYACRGNSSGKDKYCGSNELDVVAWHGGISDGTTQEVGKKQANAFGLHDMSGNVLEWCADWYKISYYSSKIEDNPQGPSSGQYKILRGCSWISYPMDCRAAYRYHYLPEEIYEHVGFRLVLPSK